MQVNQYPAIFFYLSSPGAVHSLIKNMDKLYKLLFKLEAQMMHANKRNELVSQSTVAWQIEHSLLVINAICNAVKKSDPGKYKWKFNFSRTLIYIMGRIPRGRVKAPQSVQPATVQDMNKIQAEFIKAVANIKALDSLNANCYFTHPYFGELNIKPTKTFLKLHTQHHLKIINDIVKV